VTVGRLRGERGAGIVSSLAGVTMFLAFLLLAVHVVIGLYAASVVTDAATAGARRVAGSSLTDDPDAPNGAEAKIRTALGALGDSASITWDLDPDTVAVTVRVRRPTFLRAFGAGSIERTVRVRREVLR
jgi:Flp pilus assembly protein TadG